jgi:inner membrane protein
LDNLTHSLVGAALAQVALRDGDPPARRRLLLGAGILAANLPDLDLAYVGITPPPLGYLLHHRGHTHTVLGLLGQGLAVAFLCRLIPPLRRLAAAGPARFWSVVSLGLLSHLLLDAGNSYGIHPFHPLDSRWYYGDAVFILEPGLWLLLGVPLAWNASRPLTRAFLFGLLALLPSGLTLLGVLLGTTLATLAAVGGVFAWWTHRLTFRGRAGTALGASTLFLASLFGLSALARAEARTRVEPAPRGHVVDVVLNPDPGDPLCWAVILIEKDDRAGAYVLHRGTVSIAPRWRPATRCASHRFAGREAVWETPVRQPLEGLRERSARDCRVRAWLQFGRAPVLRGDEIFDLRFERGAGDNFTAMKLRPDPESACPPHLTRWTPPRADLLEAGGAPR